MAESGYDLPPFLFQEPNPMVPCMPLYCRAGERGPAGREAKRGGKTQRLKDTKEGTVEGGSGSSAGSYCVESTMTMMMTRVDGGRRRAKSLEKEVLSSLTYPRNPELGPGNGTMIGLST